MKLWFLNNGTTTTNYFLVCNKTFHDKMTKNHEKERTLIFCATCKILKEIKLLLIEITLIAWLLLHMGRFEVN